MRFLLLALDGWPTFRPDVAALWGVHLKRHGIDADLVSAATTTAGPVPPWPAGRAWISPVGRGKVLDLLLSFMHDCHCLWMLRRDRYDAVFVRDKAFIALVALWWARWRGVPFFYWMSFPMAESLVRLQQRLGPGQWLRWAYLGWRGRVGGWILNRWVLPRADHLFVQSDRMRDDLGAQGLLPSRMTPVPMCIDPERFPAPLPLCPRADGRPVIAYLGECSRVRRIDFLFEVTAVVKQSIPDVLLLIVGDAMEPADRDWLAQEARRLDIESNVHITGWIPAEQVSEGFAQADVALALMAPDPLLDSATPTKLVEYLAMGRPVVANDQPDQRAVIEASGGGRCVAFEADAFAAAVLDLLADAQLRARMAEQGRTWVLANRNYVQCAQELSHEMAGLCGLVKRGGRA